MGSSIMVDGLSHYYFLFGWKDYNEMDDNYYLIIFLSIINNMLINIL
jgi:hypothetical protein